MCKRWQDSFVAFLEDMGERPVDMQLDRIDSDKGYYRSNCRWVTKHEQMQNTRGAKLTSDKVRQARKLFAADGATLK